MRAVKSPSLIVVGSSPKHWKFCNVMLSIFIDSPSYLPVPQHPTAARNSLSTSCLRVTHSESAAKRITWCLPQNRRGEYRFKKQVYLVAQRRAWKRDTGKRTPLVLPVTAGRRRGRFFRVPVGGKRFRGSEPSQDTVAPVFPAKKTPFLLLRVCRN